MASQRPGQGYQLGPTRRGILPHQRPRQRLLKLSEGAVAVAVQPIVLLRKPRAAAHEAWPAHAARLPDISRDRSHTRQPLEEALVSEHVTKPSMSSQSPPTLSASSAFPPGRLSQSCPRSSRGSGLTLPCKALPSSGASFSRKTWMSHPIDRLHCAKCTRALERDMPLVLPASPRVGSSMDVRGTSRWRSFLVYRK